MYKKIYRNMCLLSFTTLLIATILIISACYTYFDSNSHSELKSRADVAASFLNKYHDLSLISDNSDFDRFTLTVISPDGKIIYGNTESISKESPEIKEALKSGSGTDERKENGKDKYFYALRLKNGNILRLSENSAKMPPMFYSIMISVLFITALIYILTAIVSTTLTENIIKPIREINPFNSNELDNVYEEIRPFLKRIAHQSEEIDRQADKVTEQKARLRAIMDNINEGLVIIDRFSNILSVNKPALDIFEKTESELRHKNYTLLSQDEKLGELVRNSLDGEKGNMYLSHSDRTYQIFVSPVYEKDDISGTVMMLFDVTERIDAEKIRREFTANVSHELKTPLTTIHGYAQIIDSGIAKPEDIGGFVKKIEKESSRLMVLVNDIIELSHLDESAGETEKNTVSLRAIVLEAIDSLETRAKEMNIDITVSDSDTSVFVNTSQISEMIYNLIDNAIKYNRKSGRVDIKIGDKYIEISDTGIGIPEKYRERIFERFFRVDKSHSKMVNGTGLGLSIVKHIAKINNAEIYVESTLGKGSIFRVVFN